MDERKIAESTNSDALLHLRAHRVLLALAGAAARDLFLRPLDPQPELDPQTQEGSVSNTEAHPLAGLTVAVGGRRIKVEDWFDRVFGFQLHSDSDRVVYGHDADTRMACSFSMPTPWLMVPE